MAVSRLFAPRDENPAEEIASSFRYLLLQVAAALSRFQRGAEEPRDYDRVLHVAERLQHLKDEPRDMIGTLMLRRDLRWITVYEQIYRGLDKDAMRAQGFDIKQVESTLRQLAGSQVSAEVDRPHNDQLALASEFCQWLMRQTRMIKLNPL